MKSIAIVGCGFSGTMTAVQLMKNAMKTATKNAAGPLKIYIIERENIARGLAYSDIAPCLLLNVRADQMGAFPDDVGHFYQWLKNKNIACAPSDFISRKIYGDYLLELLTTAIKETAGFVQVEIIKDSVIDLKAETKTIFFESHSPIEFDEVVLALGLKSPAEFNFAEIKKSHEAITIIGTSLSMVDVVVYLKSINYQGKISAVSRRGRIPLAHQFYEASMPRPVFDFSSHFSLRFVLATVKSNLKIFEWRLVIDALRPHNQFLWSHWSKKEQGQFLRYLRPLWDIHRHRISPLHKKILDELMSAGQLEIKAIGFRGFTPKTSMVVKCYGPGIINNTFIQKLIEKNIVKSDCFQLGIESLKDWIHTIGPLKRGLLWESTAVPEIRVQARELSLHLLSVL